MNVNSSSDAFDILLPLAGDSDGNYSARSLVNGLLNGVATV